MYQKVHKAGSEEGLSLPSLLSSRMWLESIRNYMSCIGATRSQGEIAEH